MELQKVIYQFGNNEVFDYFILDRKENAIEKNMTKILWLMNLAEKEK
mgnify:CR=1 FL=1